MRRSLEKKGGRISLGARSLSHEREREREGLRYPNDVPENPNDRAALYKYVYVCESTLSALRVGYWDERRGGCRTCGGYNGLYIPTYSAREMRLEGC